jgi:hypothetical protein
VIAAVERDAPVGDRGGPVPPPVGPAGVETRFAPRAPAAGWSGPGWTGSRCSMTPDGIQFAIFYTKGHDRVLTPLLATRNQPHAPPELRVALRTVDQAIDQRLAHARLRTAA